jgi:hypothetical protein
LSAADVAVTLLTVMTPGWVGAVVSAAVAADGGLMITAALAVSTTIMHRLREGLLQGRSISFLSAWWDVALMILRPSDIS